MSFATSIQQARAATTLSRRKACERLDSLGVPVSERALAGYERGENEPPDDKKHLILNGLRTIATQPLSAAAVAPSVPKPPWAADHNPFDAPLAKPLVLALLRRPLAGVRLAAFLASAAAFYGALNKSSEGGLLLRSTSATPLEQLEGFKREVTIVSAGRRRC